jgi:hypothetical protein
MPLPMSRQFLRCSAVPCKSRGNQAKGAETVRPSERCTILCWKFSEALLLSITIYEPKCRTSHRHGCPRGALSKLTTGPSGYDALSGLFPIGTLAGPLRIDFWLLSKSTKEKRRRWFPGLRTFLCSYLVLSSLELLFANRILTFSAVPKRFVLFQ